MKYPGLRDRLKFLGMTQKELAGKLGLTPARLNKMLEGYEKMSVETAMRISKILGKSVEELFRFVVVEED